MLKKLADFKTLSLFEIGLWSVSVVLILLSAAVFNGEASSVVVSAVGITSLIFVARGEPLGQLLMVLFGIMYGVTSLSFRLYGEMITYMGMTAPISALTFVQWIKNPYAKDKAVVKIAVPGKKKWAAAILLTVAVTWVFYYILAFFNTATLSVSTISVATSFISAYLMFVRSHYYALGYAANDIVLICLWAINKNVAMVICFSVFLVNDIYGFISWRRRKEEQL